MCMKRKCMEHENKGVLDRKVILESSQHESTYLSLSLSSCLIICVIYKYLGSHKLT